MKISKTLQLMICISFVAILSGCASFDSEEEKPEIKKETVAPTADLNKCKNVEEAGKKMIDSICRGLVLDNYSLYSRDFTEKHKKYFNKEMFDKASEGVRENLGEYKGVKYIGFWKKGGYDILLWKAKFSDSEDDILIEMYVEKEDDGYKIAALKLI